MLNKNKLSSNSTILPKTCLSQLSIFTCYDTTLLQLGIPIPSPQTIKNYVPNGEMKKKP